jgi:outer membrane receptor protein involved in Fe transport
MTVGTFGRQLAHTLLAMLVCVCCAGRAYAQESPRGSSADAELQQIVVTGSRIARPELDRLQPTTILGADSIEERGLGDIGQALSELPGFGIQSASAANSQGTFGIAQSFVDLYSLGSQRTLTLVNGRRFVSSSTASLFNGASSPGQQVDLNLIPTKLIDRIETVSVGGAPIYGADAIAGTVNIILKKNYQGLDLDAQVGVSDNKDAWNYRFRALGGHNFADGRGNITAVFEVSKSDGLTGSARKVYAQDAQFLTPATPGPFQTVLTSNTTVPIASTGGVPYVDDFGYFPGLPPQAIGVTNAAGQPVAFGPGGALQPYNLGTATGNPVFWSGGDGFRLSSFTNILSPLERINFDTVDDFEINEHLHAFGETWFSETHARNLIAQPTYNFVFTGAAGTVRGNYRINVNNPFLTPAEQSLIQSALNAYQANGFPVGGGAPLDPNWSPNTFYLSRANVDLQSNGANGDEVLGRGVVGLNGDFVIGERKYQWETGINYGYSRNDSSSPVSVFQNVQNALNAIVNPQGQIACAPNQLATPIATRSSSCAPLNIFGEGSPSAAALAYITHDAEAKSIDTQRDGYINLNGDLFKLPAGEWKVAIGYENRRESADFRPDDYYTADPAQWNTAAPVNGSYVTNEVYAESLVPLFEPQQDFPLLHQLELEGAVRRVQNSIAGTSTTWTAGLRWAPVQDILFRGNRTVSIRAPAITELFLPAASSGEFAGDPCDHNFAAQGQVPATRQKNCAAAGINTATFTSNVVNASVLGVTSGNAGLQSETADSFTYGVVLRPHWIPRLNLSVDFININMANAIEQLSLNELMDECYDASDFPANAACGKFTRDPTTHQVTGFHDGFINAGRFDFKGISAALQYGVELPADIGRLDFQANYLQTRLLQLQVGSSAPLDEVSTLGLGSATPRTKATGEVTYTKGPLSWYWQAQFVSRMKFSNQDLPDTRDISSVAPWWVFNSTITYRPIEKLQARFIINNVFDKLPPYPALANSDGQFASPTSLYFSGIIGRTYVLNVDYRF